MSKFLDEYGLARVWQNIKSYIQQNSGSGGSVDIPSGIICAWAGSEDDVPIGWHLCDGNESTPDLRGRFILGNSSSHSIGSTGGEETHKLTVGEMPSHSHNTYWGNELANQGSYIGRASKGSFTVIEVATGSEGGSTAHNNMPPYYVLAYIMKL